MAARRNGVDASLQEGGGISPGFRKKRLTLRAGGSLAAELGLIHSFSMNPVKCSIYQFGAKDAFDRQS